MWTNNNYVIHEKVWMWWYDMVFITLTLYLTHGPIVIYYYHKFDFMKNYFLAMFRTNIS